MDMRQFVEGYLGPPKSRGNKWWTWHCQVNRPDRHPSLKVEPNGFKCFSCGAYASREEGRPAPEVSFLVKEMGWNWQAAERAIGDYQERGPRPEPKSIPLGMLPPSVEWRRLFGQEARMAEDRLMGLPRVAVRELVGRGLGQLTWQRFGVGYSPEWVRVEQFDTWLAEGIVFSAIVNNQLWSLEVRVMSGDLKYHRPKGGSEPVPFGLNQLVGKDTLIICEGAFDALAAWQVCHGEVDVVALRGAANELGWWERYLEHPRKILALDADKAGDEAAERIMRRHPTWERRRPPEGMDLGDMLKEGLLTKEWLDGM
jgi:hypothetical protein